MSNYEVRFRGENEVQLLAWKPVKEALYECTAMEARERYDDLVARGIVGVEVDGVVPYVVEIIEVTESSREGQDCRLLDPVLTQVAEEDAVPWGPWTWAKAA